jgi:exodeoxyribonuclease-3
MDIVTWNCNSLTARRTFVEAFLDAEPPDVLVLQELKLETDKVPRELFTSRGYEVAVHGQKSWNGVLIASRRGLRCVDGSPGRR